MDHAASIAQQELEAIYTQLVQLRQYIITIPYPVASSAADEYLSEALMAAQNVMYGLKNADYFISVQRPVPESNLSRLCARAEQASEQNLA